MKLSLSIVLFCLSISVFGQELVSKKVCAKDGVTVKSFDYLLLADYLKIEDDEIKVVNFWATWCAPCIKELPHFEKINSEYKKKGVEVILVSLDMAKQVEKALIPFIMRRKLGSDVVHLHDVDADVWINKVDPSWSGAIPATLIISKDRRAFFEKEFTYDELQSEILKFIK
ncbi:MAG: TlpA family protein disulfide reductase [Flavobacterium sp.]|nr:TlpA family protein disulfide reductase [Flavobacterium sp.]